MLSTPQNIELLILGNIGNYEEDKTEYSATSAGKI